MKEYYFGTGRRKTAIAQVRIFKGTGKIIDKEGSEVASSAIKNETDKLFGLLSIENKYDISLILTGGGFSAQAEAVRLGLARALIKANDEYAKVLKKEGFLTRDPREKERKKPGLKRARRAPQWAKR